MLAGRGAWLAGAGTALGVLADATGAVTVTTALGRSIFPGTEYDLGVAGGFGAEGAMALVREADVALVFGASLNQFTMRFGSLFAPGARVVQVDVAPVATHPHVGGFLRGDAAVVARMVVEELEAIGASPGGWRESRDVATLRSRETGEALAADGRLDPRSAAVRIGESLPEDRVVVSDCGHFIGWAMYWPVTSPDRLMMVGTAYQSIGLGFPSVPGREAGRSPRSSSPPATAVASRRSPTSSPPSASPEGGDWPSSGATARTGRRSPLRAAGSRPGADAHPGGRLGAPREGRRRRGRGRAHARRPRPARRLGGDPGRRASLLLDLRVSTDVVAPYQQEVIRVSS